MSDALETDTDLGEWVPDCTPEDLAAARACLQRETDSQAEGGKYRVLVHRTWQDEYPDTITVSVQVGDSDGIAMVVVSAGAVWLHGRQVDEITKWMTTCTQIAAEFNERHASS